MTLWQRFLHVTHIRRQRKLRFPNGIPRVAEPAWRVPLVIPDEWFEPDGFIEIGRTEAGYPVYVRPISWPEPYLPPVNLDNLGPDPRYNGREHG